MFRVRISVPAPNESVIFVEIKIEKIRDLDHKTYKRLYVLNNGRIGWVMRPTLVAFRNDNSRYWKLQGTTYRTFDNPEAHAIYGCNEEGTIVSWSLLYNNHGKGEKMYAQIFTSAKHRKKGYGKQILKVVFKFSQSKFGIDPHYFPHNCGAKKFFDRVVLKTHKGNGTSYWCC